LDATRLPLRACDVALLATTTALQMAVLLCSCSFLPYAAKDSLLNRSVTEESVRVQVLIIKDGNFITDGLGRYATGQPGPGVQIERWCGGSMQICTSMVHPAL
jgi:hypothetical protein